MPRLTSFVSRFARQSRRAEARQPGGWEGRVRIAPDFEELPEDLAEAFGVTARPSTTDRTRTTDIRTEG